jgi:hypothetical protein
MSKLEGSTALERRLMGRLELNRRTAETHPDPTARQTASVRADAYETALIDLRELLVFAAKAKEFREPVPQRVESASRHENFMFDWEYANSNLYVLKEGNGNWVATLAWFEPAQLWLASAGSQTPKGFPDRILAELCVYETLKNEGWAWDLNKWSRTDHQLCVT